MNPKLSRILLSVVMVLALTGVYWNHFDNAFHFDDMHTIVNNQFITDIRYVPRIFVDAQTTSSLPTNQAYRPVVTTLNAVDYWLAGGLDPRVFHWHIFLEFLVLLAVLYLVLLEVFASATGKRHHYVALFGTAFFAFHTATAETINYIISRSDGFSTLMVLLGFLIFVKSSGWKKQLGLFPYLIGCLTKPTALMLAPLLAFWALFIERPSLSVRPEKSGLAVPVRRATRDTIAFFVLGVLMYAFTRSMFSETWTPGGRFSSIEYLNTQAYVIWVYVKTFFLPTGLTADTDLEVIQQLLAPKVLWGLAVIFVMVLIGIWGALRRSTLPIAFGIAWFFIALAPSSSVVPLAEVMNHHRTFFPYIGLVMAFSWGMFLLYHSLTSLRTAIPWTAAFWVLAVALLSAHAYGTHQRNEVWDSSDSLWYDVTVKSPNNGRGLMNYGLALMRQGDFEGALTYFQKARNTTYGNHPYLFINMAIATAHQAKIEDSDIKRKKAERLYLHSIRIGSKFPQTHFRYADFLFKNGRTRDALKHVDRAIALAPANKEALELRARIVEASMSAEHLLARQAEIASSPEDFLSLSLAYYKRGEYEKSIAAATSALALRPDYALAYNNICSAHNQTGNFEAAIRACEQALALKPDFTRARNNLEVAKQGKLRQPK